MPDEAKYTPGPWHHHAPRDEIIGDNDDTVVDVTFTSKADIALITAAPDLLKYLGATAVALEAMLRARCQIPGSDLIHPASRGLWDSGMKVVNDAREIMSRAKGQTSE